MPFILVVDDEPENLELLEGILTPAGHTIRKASDGRQALQAVEEDLPEIILLDLVMPGVSGFEVCEMLRAQDRTAHIPIIVITALDQFGIKERVLTMGADDYLMPELSGLETLEQFRKRAPDLPVVILTAHPSSQNAITALKLGAFDFIVKGLQHELVVLAVRRAVHHFAELREKRHAIATLEARVRELEGRLAT